MVVVPDRVAAADWYRRAAIRRLTDLVKRLLLVLTAVLALVTTACGSTGTSGASSAAAVVNGSTITMDQLTDELAASALAFFGPYDTVDAEARDAVYGPTSTTYSAAFTADTLQSLIIFQLIEDEADARGISPDASDIQAAEQALEQQAMQWQGEPSEEFRAEQVRRNALAVAVNRAVEGDADDPGVSDEEVRAYYDDNVEQWVAQSGEFACVSHILLAWSDDPDAAAEPNAEPTPEQKAAAQARATDVEAQLAAGADFGQLAAQYSGDPGSKDVEGNLGCRPAGQEYVPEFEAAIWAQPVGEVGSPVETEFGYHVIVVRSRGIPPFEDLEETIRSYLDQQSASSSPLQQWIIEQAASADIEVNPQVGTWTAQGLVPPEGSSTQTTVAPDGGVGTELPIDLSQLTTGG